MVLPNENKLGISNLDTVAAFLSDKLVAGTNISLQVLNSGGNEQLEITSNNLTWKGEWSASEGYNINDLVTYLGVTYIAYDTVLPTDTEDFPDRPNITPSKWGSLISPVSPSITIGSVTTGAAGSSAVVTNSGTEAAPILNFIIPRGDKGTSGSAGTTGTSGNDGQAATITIGTVTTGLPNSAVSVQNVGTVTNAVFNFSIPKGEQGDAGDTGDTGAKGDAGTITVGTVTNPPAGSSVTVTNVGTSSDAILNFAIPKGYASDIVRTSTDSVTIGTGSKTFTYEQESFNIGYGLGSRLRAYYDSTHYMEGVVTSGVDLNTQVTINVDKAVGSGTWAVWNIVIAGQPVTQAELDAKVNVSDVVNTLTETNAGKVLDGRQGKVLSDAIALKANTNSLATVATTGAYADLSGKPTLATVATSGSYTDLSSKPTLGTAAALDVGTAANQVVQLTNDAKLPAVDGSLLTGIGSTASDITVDTTNFNLNLSGTDTTVQLALETLDDLIAGAGGHTIQNEGTPLTARTNLNFIGTAITATDNSGADSTDVTINLPTTGSGLNLGTWDDSGTFTSGVRFDGSADKVILPQATTAERTAITPLASELIYDTDEDKFYYGDGTTVGGKAVGGGNFSLLTDKALYYYDSVSGLFKPIEIGTLGQTLIAQPSSNPPYQWATPTGGRELLTANRTYYVRTDGSDSNTGLANTSGGAFLTIQKALDVVGALDISIYTATIKLETGTYTLSSTIYPQKFVGNSIVIEGDTTTPSNVIITGSIATGFLFSFFGISGYTLKGVTLENTGASGRHIELVASFLRVAKLKHSTCQYSLRAQNNSVYYVEGNYEVAASMDFCYIGSSSTLWSRSVTITVSGNPTWTSGMFMAESGGVIDLAAATYSGSASGNRYNATTNSVIRSTNTIPGTTGGTIATGGQYTT